MPKYDARAVARKMSEIYGIPIIYGSATPDIRTYYKALNNEIKLLKLKNRISKEGMPEISIVDMREELASGNKTPFSRKLCHAIKGNIEKGEQTMLFLNRRGYSTFIMCRDCGYTLKCPNCNISLTYHISQNILKCHYCRAPRKTSKNMPKLPKHKNKIFWYRYTKIRTRNKQIIC